MPRLLKRETYRRLTVCQETLTLAFSLLSKPKSLSYGRRETDGAIEIGLIGIAADLAISACLYESVGSSAIKREKSGFYLTAGEALNAFRKMISSSVPALTQGLPDPVAQLRALGDASEGFGVLFTARAAAVHAGAGTSYDVAFYVGKTVADFLVLLAESSKWKPYLKEVPAIPGLPKDRTLIAQELSNAALRGDGAAIAGIFLVLPELSQNEPDWLASLERVQVTPKANDINVLVKSLRHGGIGELYKVGKGTEGIATKIDANASGALSIYPAAFKKIFNNTADSWGGYVGNANASINKGFLDLPPVNAIYSFSAMGLEKVGLPAEELSQGLSAHVLWAFIASALHYAGTKGPCFFLVRHLKVDEGGQLAALLTKAGEQSPKIQKALALYLPAFASIYDDRPLRASAAFKKDFIDRLERRILAKGKLHSALAVRAKTWSGDGRNPYKEIEVLISEPRPVGDALLAICDGSVLLGDDRSSILRLLVEAASDKEDVTALGAVLSRKDLDVAWTGARQAIRSIDYSFYGPQVAK